MKIKQPFLALFAILIAGVPSANASVQVYGEATSSGPDINVAVFADITSPAIVSFSFKLFYPASQLQVVTAARNDGTWYFHDGSARVPYPAPETSTPGQVLFVGGRMDAANPLAGVTGNRVLLGTVLFSRLDQDAPNFDMSIGRSGNFASFVAVDGTVLEAQAGVVSFQSVNNDPNDNDLDSLNDKWEEKYFGSTKEVFYSDDSDRDGVDAKGEEAMGSDPTDPRSLLRLDIVNGKEQLVLEWQSAEGRVYSIEAAKELNRFEVLREGILASPPLNSFELDRKELGEVLFFRIRVGQRPR